MNKKIHYREQTFVYTRCGIYWRNCLIYCTYNPKEVTCKSCIRSIKADDKEVKNEQRRRI